MIGWASLGRLALNWRTWAVVGVGAVLINQAVVTRQRDQARELAASRAQTINALDEQKTSAERDLALARLERQRAELTLRDFADASLSNFQQQAEDSARASAELAELNRRVRAAQQEIARADGSLRLDDPMPRGLRDALACAGGDAPACVSAPQTPAGLVPGGAADAARPAGPAA